MLNLYGVAENSGGGATRVQLGSALFAATICSSAVHASATRAVFIFADSLPRVLQELMGPTGKLQVVRQGTRCEKHFGL